MIPTSIRTCMALDLTGDRAVEAARLALLEHEGNQPPTQAASAMFGYGRLSVEAAPHFIPAAISLIGKTWQPGRTLGVGFLGGSDTQRSKVRRWVQEWSQFANIGFDFNATRPELRVDFTPNAGSWSLIGTDALTVPAGQPTINFGWVTNTSDDTSDRAVILHEFGHALSLGHEQSSPGQDIQWNYPKAFAYYMATQGWSAEMVQQNVFDVYGRSQVEGTPYDRASIMQYPVPAELTLDGRGIGWNTDLSDLDKQHIAAILPGRATPPTPPPPRPPGRATILFNGPAAMTTIDQPGSPARFEMAVPGGPGRSTVVKLAVVVEHDPSRRPRVLATPSGMQPFALGMPGGRGTFQFKSGVYDLDVFHSLPHGTGRVWIKAVTNAG